MVLELKHKKHSFVDLANVPLKTALGGPRDGFQHL